MEYLQYSDITVEKAREILVLNLIINGIPSIRIMEYLKWLKMKVLNLIINGIPSIPLLISILKV